MRIRVAAWLDSLDPSLRREVNVSMKSASVSTRPSDVAMRRQDLSLRPNVTGVVHGASWEILPADAGTSSRQMNNNYNSNNNNNSLRSVHTWPSAADMSSSSRNRPRGLNFRRPRLTRTRSWDIIVDEASGCEVVELREPVDTSDETF